jgi:hypothetical protein
VDFIGRMNASAWFGYDGLLLLRLASFTPSGCGQKALLQVGKPSSARGLPFDEFESIDMPFHRPCTVGKRQSRQNRRFVPLETASKGEEFSDARCPHVFEPALKSLTAVVANEMQEAVGQLSCLREDIIHLRDLIQLLLCLRRKPPRDGPASTR